MHVTLPSLAKLKTSSVGPLSHNNDWRINITLVKPESMKNGAAQFPTLLLVSPNSLILVWDFGQI